MLLPAQGPRWLESARSVSALTYALKRAVESEFKGVLVMGEVSGERRSGGHLYFTLKDSDAQIPCAIWRSQLSRIATDIRGGMRVAVRGDIEIYPPHGRYQLIVREAHDIGKGALHAELAALAARLQAEGLFAAERKRPLPLLPRRVGIVTALGAAALADVLRIVTSRYPADILVSPSRVQGDGAGAELAAALRRLFDVPNVDVILITRGGGSAEDLSAFNDEDLVRAIAASPVPVVSAIGHEIDTVLSDLVADVRAPTPSAAAALVLPSHSDLVAEVDELAERLTEAVARRLGEGAQHLEPLSGRLARALERRLERARATLERAAHRLALARPERRLAVMRRRLEKAEDRLGAALPVLLERRRARLQLAHGRLAALSPLASLDRGYAIVRKEGGAVVTGPADVAANERVEIIVRDGRFGARRVDEP
jgi:exodeoxyribonuclease VII large subunit